MSNWPTPCVLCGYNGPGFYQPSTHPCMKHATERDALLAEVERLRERLEWQVECTKGLTAALRTVAERQREACAQTMLYVWPSIGPDAAATVRATLLVTEGDK